MKKSERFIKELERLLEFNKDMIEYHMEDDPIEYLEIARYQERLFMLESVMIVFNEIYNGGVK